MGSAALLYDLKAHNIDLWAVAGTDEISFSFDPDQGFPEYLKKALRTQKKEVLALLRFNKTYSEKISRATPFYRLPSTNKIELSPIQKGMWTQSLQEKERHAYTIPFFFHLPTSDATLVRKALDRFLENTPFFRRCVDEKGEGTLLSSGQILIEEKVLSQSAIQAFQQKTARIFFEPGQPLCKIFLVNIQETQEIMLGIVHHHMLSDAFSLTLIEEQIRNFLQDPEAKNPLPQLSYADYLPYQRVLLSRSDHKKAIHKLQKDFAQAMPLSLPKTQPGKDAPAIAFQQWRLESALYESLKKRANDEGISPYGFLLTALYGALATYSGTSEPFPLGITVSHRPHAFADVVGPFINLLPLIPSCADYEAAQKVWHDIHQHLLKLNTFQNLNITDLTDAQPFDLQGKLPLLFTFHNFVVDDISQNQKILETVEKFGISLTAHETPQGDLVVHITHALHYARTMLEAIGTLWTRGLKGLITGDATNPLYTFFQDDALGTDAHAYGEERPFPQSTLHQLIEEQVKKTPDHEAVRFEGHALTYSKLNNQANAIAAHVQHHLGVYKGAPICVCLDRSLQMLPSLFGVLKAGGCYVPIDPGYPPERVRYVLEDTETPVVITERKYQDLFKGRPTLVIEDLDTTHPSTLRATTGTPDDLAYMIYTSGTTGKPKGVMCSHRGIINRLTWMSAYCPLTKKDRILQKTPYVFDVSVWELFWPLLHGACVVFEQPEAHKDPHQILRTIKAEGITILHFVPSLLSQFLEVLGETESGTYQSLTHVFASGESLSTAQVQTFTSKLPTVSLHNLYGPTEAAVDVSFYKCTGKEKGIVPIGCPIFNTSLHVLGVHGQPIPKGAVGELYIGGAGLARGYWRQQALTAKRFVNFSPKANIPKRLYRTGDRAQWREDSQLLFLGRQDFQVKLHGHRIELQEIEAVLKQAPRVEEAVITLADKPSGDVALVAYYNAKQTLSDDTLRDFLASKLPAFMLPELFVYLEKMPLSISGKLDRKNLPSPTWSQTQKTGVRLNAQEKRMASLWAEILNVSPDHFAPEDDFFHVGGDSILAIQLAARLKRYIDIQVRDLFHHRTLRALANLLPKEAKKSAIASSFTQVRDEGDLAQLPVLEDGHPEAWFEMTEIQKAYLLGRSAHYEVGNISNHIYSEFYYAHLDLERLEKALNRLVQSAPSLRLVLCEETLKQRYLGCHDVSFYAIRLHEKSDETLSEKTLKDIRHTLSHKVYDVTHWPLFTFEVSRFKDGWVLHVSMDLILLDVQSRLKFFAALDALYNNLEAELPAMPITFKTYQDHIEKLKASPWYARDRTYWRQKILTMPTRPTLPFKTPPHEVKTPIFSHHTLMIEANVWRAFKENVRAQGLSESSVLLAFYGRTLALFTGVEKFLITLTLFNRYPLHPNVSDLWGDFTSTLLFAFDDMLCAWHELLQTTHAHLWEDIQHSFYSGVCVQRDLSRHLNWDPNQALSPIIFTSVLGKAQESFEDTPFLDHSEHVGKRYWCAQTSQAWIDLQAVEVGGTLMSKWLYVVDIFDEALIARMNQVFCTLITQWAENKKIAFGDTFYLTKTEKEIIRHDAVAESTSEKTLLDLLEPYRAYNTCAIWDDNLKRGFSHQGLAQDSTHLASQLLAHLKSDEPLIGIFSEKGYAQVVGVLGILKTGRAYLPLSYDWPPERLKSILTQASVTTLLTTQDSFSKCQGAADTVLILEDLYRCASSPKKPTSLPRTLPTDVAYVIFTSGSTGEPKGVTITHQSAMNTIEAVNQRFQVSEKDAVLALSDLSFDLSVYDIFGLLGAGGKVVFPAQRETKNPLAWAELIQQQKVTVWNSVPQLANLLFTENKEFAPKTLRLFLLSGDWIPLSLPDTIRTACPAATITGLGGATEGSIWSIWYDIQEVNPSWRSIPYGYAMPGQALYVLNHHGGVCPIGVPGDLFIGGLGLAKDYWKASHLTQASYHIHPSLGRLYRTDDRGSYAEDGTILFLGRQDHQIKRHGYRVELKEIEKTIRAYPEIQNAFVTQRSGQLIGYYQGPKSLEEASLSTFLQSKLPPYMVPDFLLRVSTMPLSANGKIDISALPLPETDSETAFQAPETPIEETLRTLWADVLNFDITTISTQQSFFHLGGDSLTGIRLIARIKHTLGCTLLPQDIFMHQTITSLGNHIEQLSTHEARLSESGSLTGDVPLLPIQRWFFAQEFKEPHHWNQAFFIHTPPLDAQRLMSCLEELIAYHDAFRLRFVRDPETGVQKQHYAESTPPLNVRKGPASNFTAWQRIFDLEKGPLFTFCYIQGETPQKNRLFCAFHHLTIDTVSWQIFLDDLKTLYQGKKLPPKGTSYRQWSALIQNYAHDHPKEQTYWNQITHQQTASLKEFCDGNSKTFSDALNIAETETLLRLAHHAYGTRMDDLLLAALAGALFHLTGQENYVVALEGHGREALGKGEDVTRTVGWFTTLYPVLLTYAQTTRELIIATKDMLRGIPNKGLGYGVLKGYNRAQFPDVSFNYLGQFHRTADQDWSLTHQASGAWVAPDNHLPFKLTVNALIQDGCFQLELMSLLEASHLKNFGEQFFIQLRRILTETTQKKRRELTTSDTGNIITPSTLAHLQKEHTLQAIYPANALQQGFFYHAQQFGKIDDAYRVQNLWSYEAPLRSNLLKKAWRFVQKKFPSLRLSLVLDQEVIQVIDEEGTLQWQEHDLTALSDNQQKERVQQICDDDRRKPYDFATPGLFRVSLIKHAETKWTFLLNMHHAITDGWSAPLLMHAVHDTYLTFVKGDTLKTRQDEAYGAAQKKLSSQKKEDLAYWKKKIALIKERSNFDALIAAASPFDHVEMHTHLQEQKSQNCVVQGESFKKIQQFIQRENLTLGGLLTYLWHKILLIYGGVPQTVSGTVVSGRHLAVQGIESSVGLYAATLPVIIDHHDLEDKSVIEAIRSVQNTLQEAASYTAAPLFELQKGSRLFDALFMYEKKAPLCGPQHVKALGLSFTHTHEKRDYPLAAAISEETDRVTFQLDYAAELFSEKTIQGILRTWTRLLEQVVGHPTQKDRDLRYTKPLHLPTFTPLKTTVPIHQAFTAQAQKNPHAIVVKDAHQAMTYQALNQRANQLVAWMQRHHPLPLETPIVIFLERNAEMLVALLAVLKAGWAYLPLNPSDPAVRLKFFLEDTGAPLVLTQRSLCVKLKDVPAHTSLVCLDDEDIRQQIQNASALNPDVSVSPESLAYILYTSGTTGTPKSVMINHVAYMTTVLGIRQRFFPTKKSLSTHSLTEPTFDIFGLEYGLPLLSGGTLTLGSTEDKSFDLKNCDFFQTTPSLLDAVLPTLQNTNQTTLLVGGEAPPPDLIMRSLKKFQRVITVYGPTETTIWSSAFEHEANTPYKNTMLGQPLEGEILYILDKDQKPLPPHAPGMLYIGGTGLARGYWKHPDLTKKSFVTCSLASDTAALLYNTGDRGYKDEAGHFVYLGREDMQVKVRGMRFECGEIESVLQAHAGVKQAIVLPKKQGQETRITAYVVEKSGYAENILREFLKERLPDAMIPERFVTLASIPLTPHGKVDCQALLALTTKALPSEARVETSTAQSLRNIFQRVLEVDAVDPQKNFFDQGIHSLHLIKILHHLPSNLKGVINVVDFFSYPTIASLAHTLDKKITAPTQHSLRAKVSSFHKEDIAIIGMAGRFPGAHTIEAFWDVIQSGETMTSFYTAIELEAEGIDASVLANPHYVKAQNRLNHLKCFDAEFFGYSRREAEMMDPQHRFLMECAWEALQDAHLEPKLYAGKVGIYAGSGHNSYAATHVLPHFHADDPATQYQIMIHTQEHFLCSKIAYKLGLTGPAMTLQTACSTSLVAVHQACQALQNSDCDVALAGGVSIRQLQKEGYTYQEGLVFSPQGLCLPFDGRANGTVEGQGVGLVVLKPLGKALRDGDAIHAVIKASAVNNDGNLKAGYTAPSPEGQVKLIQTVHEKADLSSETIELIETHGTGTALGDPIEIRALTTAFQATSTQRQFCTLGTLKNQIGHLDVAAGIAGLIKAVLCLKHRTLPHSPYYQTRHPHIDLEKTPFVMNRASRSWESRATPRRAGVSAFGIGGTNAHVLLEEYPDTSHEQKRTTENAYQLKKTEYWLESVHQNMNRVSHTVLPAKTEPLRATLYDLWSKALGCTQTGPDDDFFQSGGDSLAAIQLKGQIQKEWGVAIDLMDLNPPTFKSLLNSVQSALQKKADAISTPAPLTLSVLQKGKAWAATLVLIHPIGGDLYAYKDLVASLPNTYNVYGLRSPLLDADTRFEALEDLAQTHAQLLKKELSSPYCLAGFSFGGIVAYAMAQVLNLASSSIPLVLIDAPAYGNLPAPMTDGEVLLYLLRYGTSGLAAEEAEFLRLSSLDEKITFLEKRTAGTPHAALFSADFLKQFLKTWQHHSALMQNYRPQLYGGPVSFFSHQEVIPDFPTNQHLHWKQWAKGALQNISSPGHHLSMLTPPHVHFLAAKLSQILDAISLQSNGTSSWKKII